MPPEVALRLLLPLLAACSDYELAPKTEAPGHDTGEAEPPDSAPPTDTATCRDFAAPEPMEVATDEGCIREPEEGSFDPVVEWQWSDNELNPGYHQVISMPVVANVTDDNGDGAIDERDTPDIIFTSFTSSSYYTPTALNVISGDGSGMHWSITSAGGYQFYGISGPAVGDIDADGSPDICTPGPGPAIVCVEGSDGTFKWAAGSEVTSWSYPSIADMDGDGYAEVIYGRQVFDHLGNTLMVGAYGSGSSRYNSFAVDWDGDGQLEVVAGNTVYELDGTVLWYDGGTDGYSAVGDFDLDGLPDAVRVASGTLILSDNSGAAVWSVSIPGGGTGGPPTVADFDGDGWPEVGVAALSLYSVFDTDGSVLWSNPTEDDSSSVTGSSVFDFEGDGAAEVVYADEHTVWVYDGATGAVLLSTDGHASGTAVEYPVVADVDGDDSTEIVVASCNYPWSGWTGITVIGDESNDWSPARPIWNQHAYHITNVDNDGSIPSEQVPNWQTWNNFRAGGTELGPSHWQADLLPGDPSLCLDDCDSGELQVYVPIGNGGLIRARDFAVSFYAQAADGTRTEVRSETVAAVAQGDSTVLGPFTFTFAEWGTGLLVAVVDSGDAIDECDEDDNEVELGRWPCGAM